MIDDLVKQLRAARESGDPWGAWHLALQAADRIEKLEAALQRANANVEEYERKFYLGADRVEKLEAALRELSDDWPCCDVSKAMREIARKALDGKDD